MNLIVTSLLLLAAPAPAAVAAPDFTAKLDVPSLRLGDRAPPLADVPPHSCWQHRPGRVLERRPWLQRRGAPSYGSHMPIIEPDPTIDYKMLVKNPDESIDYKMLTRETPDRRKQR